MSTVRDVWAKKTAAAIHAAPRLRAGRSAFLNAPPLMLPQILLFLVPRGNRRILALWAVRELLPRLRQTWRADFVIINGENAAGGAGLTAKTAEELFAAGADVITTGDHIWDHKEIAAYIQREPRLLRPLNYPPGAPGEGLYVARNTVPPLAVINLQGRVFMPELDNPFLVVERELERHRGLEAAVFIDFHAEATSEKIAMARMLDGRIAALIGTHTHVQTADEQIFPGGTAYLTDAGFTGPHESVIGRKIQPIIERFRTNLPRRFDVASGGVLLQGAVVEIDSATRRATAIRRVSEPLMPFFSEGSPEAAAARGTRVEPRR